MNCPRCNRQLWGASLYCIVHGDHNDRLYVPNIVPEPKFAGRMYHVLPANCPGCGKELTDQRRQCRVCSGESRHKRKAKA